MDSYKEQVRYSETDVTLHLSNLAIVNLLQDAAIHDAQNSSISVEELYVDKLAWLLGSWQIQILKRPRLNDLITITTIPYEFKGFLGYRNFTITNEAGEILIQATSIWSLINMETLKPARITPELMARYTLGEKLDMDYKPRKIILNGEGVEEEEIRVKKYQIDSNHHMNNSAYVGVALEYVPEEIEIKEIRVEYKNAAYLGDKICPVVYKSKDCIQVDLHGENGSFAIVEISY